MAKGHFIRQQRFLEGEWTDNKLKADTTTILFSNGESFIGTVQNFISLMVKELVISQGKIQEGKGRLMLKEG